jgi:DNA-binding winged helix-turn-helix (wHTH) protein
MVGWERTPVTTAEKGPVLRFGAFELDTDAEQLSKNGRTIRLQPQPFKLLRLLAGLPGRVVTREEIQAALWKGDTYVDFEQGVNFAVKQVREALGEDAERPIYIQTVPKRGYRFLAPVEVITPGQPPTPLTRRTDLNLHKALWANIAELRLIEERRQKRRKVAIQAGLAVLGLGILVALLIAAF